MEPEFWHERWRLNQTGFHKEGVHPHLQQYWPRLQVAAASRVFVPLCGKSNDLLWLAEQGYRVVGVELSPLAVAAFFAENALEPVVYRQGDFQVTALDELQIYCGDYFALRADDLQEVQAVYDRGALVALPDGMRADYAAKMVQFLPPAAQILLVVFDYAQAEMPGPPFCISEKELDALFGDCCEIELLGSENILDAEPRFRERGLSRMLERTYRLTVR